MSIVNYINNTQIFSKMYKHLQQSTSHNNIKILKKKFKLTDVSAESFCKTANEKCKKQSLTEISFNLKTSSIISALVMFYFFPVIQNIASDLINIH